MHRLPSRRAFLRQVGGITVVATTACSPYYRPESGPAFAPWDFPDPELDPRLSLVHAALLAANPHNSQPWAFVVSPSGIELFADFERNLGAIDPFLREMHVGLGCALENLLLAARHEGWDASTQLFPDPQQPSLVARVALAEGAPRREPLFDAIAHRHTNRGRYAQFDLDPRIEDAMQGLVDEPELTLVRLEGDALGTWKRATVEATEALLADREMSDDSHAWFRHSLDDITEHRDGITTDAAGLGAGTRFFGKITRPRDADEAGEYWLRNTREVQVATFSGVFALCNEDRLDPLQQVATGRVWQRLHLWCASEGLDVQPINQLIEMADRELQLEVAPRFGDELASLAGSQLDPAMLFRVGYAHLEAYASPRRPVEWVTEEVG